MSKYVFYGTLIQTMLCSFLFSKDLNGQHKPLNEIYISIDNKNASLKEIFASITEQTDLYFTYNTENVNDQIKVRQTVNQNNLNYFLRKLSREHKLGFKRVNNHIFVINRGSKTKAIEDIILPSEGMLERITGRVTSEDDSEPLPGVSILLKGTTNGVITDPEGNYTITAPVGGILVFSFVGYKTQERVIGNESVINVQMIPDLEHLEEIVVVGYGVQKKSNVSGSIVSVGADDIARTQNSSFDAALQGKVPGVYVTTNGGQPGGGVSIRIRGAGTINNSNPLYVIDGVIIGAGNDENFNPLVAINPNDIESIDILKDAASAAIYGARAANGVVLITTKRGKTGKPQVSYSAYAGIQKAVNNLTRPLNATEYATRMNTAFTAAGEAEPFPNPASLGEGTNYLDEVIGDGFITDHQLSISGGSEKSNYYVSMNYFDNDGIMLETFQRRFSIRANTDHQLSEKVKVGNSLFYSRGSRFDNDAGLRTFIHGSFTSLYLALPTTPVFDPSTSTGYGGPTDTRLERRRNQVSFYELPDRDNASDRVLGNVYLEYSPIPGLKFRTSYSADIQNTSNYIFTPRFEEGLINSDGRSVVNQLRDNSFFWLWENTVTYTGSIGKNNFSITGGTTAQELKFRKFESQAEYEIGEFTEIMSSASILTANSESFEESLASVFGRVTYDYDNKYLFTFAVRRDGSSKFGPDNKFGVFPSFTAGWRVSEEPFFVKDGLFTDLKIRGGWGQVGSDAIGNFKYLATLNSTFNYAFGNQNGITSIGTALENLANAGVQWETATEYNFGFDAGFLDGKLSFSAEYYNRTRNDMLLTLPLPGVSGLKETIANVGELVNKGFEFAAGYRKVTGDVTFDFNANLSTISSEVVDLGGLQEIVAFNYSGSGSTILIRPGEPLGSFYTRRGDGIFQTQAEVEAANAIDGNDATPYQNVDTAPGDFRWKDLNGDGRVDNNDKELTGSPIPKFTYGFGANMNYKNFDLSFQFFGVQGNKILNITRSLIEGSGRTFNKSSTVLNGWSGPGTSNTIPRAITTDPNQNGILSDQFIEDGSYLRLRNLQIGYTLPEGILSPLGVSTARVYVAGQNLFVLTGYSGIDPEVGFDENNSAVAGVDNDLYPQVRTWSVGVNVSF
ncbi:TonB-dependent receptor [Fulvivirgaceae bacterium BMA12]|uniref:TonB-dependent receptor n=1 Tax=Agaribacillus aureus TaxID=3051825 RepID=A0ABT8LHX3_9BACT|nr:TonB-dependent receptor [Fulvivirgaceae bacterium BMA12]